ncbi:outer membrane protein [Geoalkalibacter halelectricus]|uniref:outer membrane protein n=1 Tax=Geoalkalibacter halelectricus TaxID=2847045 RepID=UPI0021B34485|nr:outer membrane beta-barrel protein [Geoalkalibacter halelectricus]
MAPGERVSGKFSFDNGIAFLGAIGGEFAGDFRGEIELGYRNNDLDRLHADGGGSVSIGGDVTTISLMANIIKDFPLGTGFTPFIGAGIGMANIEAEIRFAGLSDKEDDNVFAYQFFAGGGIDLAPKVKLDLQYRFFATSDPDFNGLESEYLSHNFLAGLRFGF